MPGTGYVIPAKTRYDAGVSKPVMSVRREFPWEGRTAPEWSGGPVEEPDPDLEESASEMTETAT